jgi:lipid II:glycine glycyltransferase (peptidoglycan interpeptide bridge formation enzyme)
MRKSTRYEIRRAEKVGITTSVSTDSADLDTFYKHQLELAQKHGFVAFSKSFLTKQFETFSAESKAILVHAHQGRQLLATAFLLLSNNEAVYHYGISTPENRSLPGAHVCQWRAIQEAKARGLHWYNFWGITKTENPKHRFYGVTIFKTGFGGNIVEYIPAQDIALSPFYQGTRFFEVLRRKVRRLEE